MAQRKQIQFDQQLKQALKYYNDPDRLAAESVLASAYFLGTADAVDGTPHWGSFLRQALAAAADSLWGEEPPRTRNEIEDAWSDILRSPGAQRYHYLILELRYFRRYFQPRSLQQIWEDFLQQSRAEFYRDVDAAIEALGQALLRYLRPGWRLEEPPSATPLTGRTSEIGEILAILRQGRSVGLNGVSGVGKSSLAANVASAWPSSTILWFTVRPEISDGLYQLLFALGGFLHRHDEDLLWRALAANQGRVDDPALLLALARQDLAALSSQSPLMVVDEVDLWRNDEGMDRLFQEFVVGLQDAMPMLLVGQQVEIPAHTYIALPGLDEAGAKHLLSRQDIQLDEETLRQALDVTGGNPRLLWLVIELLSRGESLTTLLEEGSGSVRSFDSFLNLLWRRLDENEREIMHALAVYPAPAPCEPWPSVVLERLTLRHLLSCDARGSVALLPSIRAVLYRALSAEQREQLHQRAAGVNAALGDYTMTAYHYQRAGLPDLAVQTWFPHRRGEIERGAAATAATIFNNVSATRLKKPLRQALDLIRAELHQLNGDLQAGLTVLEKTDWRSGDVSELTVQAHRLRGDFLDALGLSERALESYEESLTAATRLQPQMVDLHVRKGKVHLRHRQIADAAKAIQQARYQVEHFQGLLSEEQGELERAEQHHLLALKLAEELGDALQLAEANRFLSRLFGRSGEIECAIRHAEHAISYYEQVGDLVQVAWVRSNMAANYLDAGRYEEVLASGQPAFDFFRQIGHAHGSAATACNLAEASFELGNCGEAERYAHIALDEEEPLAFPYAYYTLALVREAEGAPAQAQEILTLCCQYAQRNEDIFIEAYAWLKLAEIQRQLFDEAASFEAAERAAVLFERLGLEGMVEEAKQLADCCP